MNEQRFHWSAIDLKRCMPRLLLALLTLVSIAAQAAAPAGSWWDPNYGYRRQISIPVVGAGTLAANYSLKITFDHATEVAAGRSLANGNDVRVVYWNGTTWTDLDRVVDPLSGWNSATTEIWFDTSALINGATTNDNYYLYFGNAAAGAPLANADNVFLLYDDFSAAAISGTKWGTTGTVTQSGGVATVSGNGSALRAANAYSLGTDTIWETRASMSAASGTGFNYWGASSAVTFTGSYLYFQTNAANHRANVAGTTQNITVPTPTSMTNYSFARPASGAANFWVNGAINATPTATFASGAPAGNLRALMRTDAAGLSTSYDYVRIRQYRTVEPIPTLGTLDENLIGAWFMGEASWNGTVGEVNDSGPYGFDGRAFNGAQTAGGVTGCRYGSFTAASQQYLEVPDNNALDLTSQLTVSVWVYPRSYGTELKSIVSKDDDYEFHLDQNGQVYWWWNGGGTREIRTTGTPVPLNQWTHIAITYQSGTQRVYINGVVRGTNTRAEALPTNALALQIGYDGAGSAQPLRYWDGYIDSVQIWGKALTSTQVVAAMNATQPCPMNAHHLTISHDGYGIHCLAEPITVSPRDISNNPFTTYSELITLNTGAANGDWTLLTGTGTLNNGTANDGIATYQWVSGETSATFLLTYRQGPASINITASSATITDDNTEGNILWGASGFTLTAAPLTNPPTLPITSFATAQTAGTSFPIYIAAYGTTPTDSQCGIIESYTGSKNLKFWSTYSNPNTGTLNVTINGVTASTSDPPPATASQAVVFTNGQASVNALYRDVGAINIAVKDVSVSEPAAGIRGATNDFVVKPASFAIVNSITRTSDSFVNPAAANESGTAFIAAGLPFTATVRALDSGGNATPNFGKESTPESVRLQSNLVAPSGGINPSIAGSFGTFSNGQATGAAFSWSEVGIITLTPRLLDGNYLGAGDVVGTTSGNVGRFIPYNFGVTQSNSPAIAPACAASGFVYSGAPLIYSTPPILTLTARAYGGATTQNYAGLYFKLTNTSSNGRSYTTSLQTITQSLPANDPSVSPLGAGQATMTFNVNSGVAYVHTTPVPPFTPTLTLSLNILDTDGVAASNSTTVPSSNPWAINSPSATVPEVRYGRLAYRNAVGSELLNLPLPLRAEYFLSNSAGFATNTGDSCTTGVSVTLGSYGGNLNAGETCVLDTGSPGVSGAGCSVAGPVGQRFQMPPSSGDFVSILRAPGAGNSGTVTATAVVPTWLRFDWNAANPGLEDPSGVAVFGIFQGESKRIFQTEK